MIIVYELFNMPMIGWFIGNQQDSIRSFFKHNPTIALDLLPMPTSKEDNQTSLD